MITSNINDINSLLRSIGVEGVESLNFGGQIVNNVWHGTDCSLVGTAKNNMGPFSWGFIKDKFKSNCCSMELAILFEVVPRGVSSFIKSIHGLRLVEFNVDNYLSLTDIHKEFPGDTLTSAEEFLLELAELSGAVASCLIALPVNSIPNAGSELAFSIADGVDLNLKKLQENFFQDSNFLRVLKEVTIETLNLSDCNEITVKVATKNLSANPLKNSRNDVLFDTITAAYLGFSHRLNLSSKIPAKSIATIPIWVYNALVTLTNKGWISQPYLLDDKTIETAFAIWLDANAGELDDFDNCVIAAAKCLE